MIYATGDCHGILPGASWDDEERYGHHRRRLRRRVVWRQPRQQGAGPTYSLSARHPRKAKLPLRLFGSNTTTAQLMLGISCCGNRLQKSHENKAQRKRRHICYFFVAVSAKRNAQSIKSIVRQAESHSRNCTIRWIYAIIFLLIFSNLFRAYHLKLNQHNALLKLMVI